MTFDKAAKTASDRILEAVVADDRIGVEHGEAFAISHDGLVKVRFTDIGEGLDGDYDPSDPEDISLLRYDAYVRMDAANRARSVWGLEYDHTINGIEWGCPEDSSFCTQVPSETPIGVQQKILMVLADALSDSLDAGWKGTAEEMSWADPSWAN